MTTTQYTPSPWNPSFGKIIASNGIEVCSMPSRDSANANLIAAAPDLLSALQECVRVLAEYTQYDDDDGSAEGNARLLGLAAIAKAEGAE